MTRIPPNGNATEWIKYLGAVSSLVVVVLLAPIATWLVFSTLDHSERLTAIESNRFTSVDSMRVYELLNEKADKMDVPPPIVTEAIKRMERDIRDIRAMLESHMHAHTGLLRPSGKRIRTSIVEEDDP